MAGSIRHGVSPLTDYDIFLFKQGTHYHLYEKMGAQKFTDPADNTEGIAFSVWAPNAQEVSVIGNFNGWDPGAHPLALGRLRNLGRLRTRTRKMGAL